MDSCPNNFPQKIASLEKKAVSFSTSANGPNDIISWYIGENWLQFYLMNGYFPWFFSNLARKKIAFLSNKTKHFFIFCVIKTKILDNITETQ